MTLVLEDILVEILHSCFIVKQINCGEHHRVNEEQISYGWGLSIMKALLSACGTVMGLRDNYHGIERSPFDKDE